MTNKACPQCGSTSCEGTHMVREGDILDMPELEDVPCEKCGAEKTIPNLGLCPYCMAGGLFKEISS